LFKLIFSHRIAEISLRLAAVSRAMMIMLSISRHFDARAALSNFSSSPVQAADPVLPAKSVCGNAR